MFLQFLPNKYINIVMGTPIRVTIPGYNMDLVQPPRSKVLPVEDQSTLLWRTFHLAEELFDATSRWEDGQREKRIAVIEGELHFEFINPAYPTKSELCTIEDFMTREVDSLRSSTESSLGDRWDYYSEGKIKGEAVKYAVETFNEAYDAFLVEKHKDILGRIFGFEVEE